MADSAPHTLPTPKVWIWRGCLFLIPFVLTLELGTRIEQRLSYHAPFFGEYTYETALKVQDEFGVVGKPHGRYEKWTLNSFGFRGPEFALTPAPDVTRLVCVGASETFGLFEQEGNEWPRQLEGVLSDPGRRVEVLNAAMAGMTMRRRINHFEEKVLPLQPGAVALMLEYPSYVGIAMETAKGGLGGDPEERVEASMGSGGPPGPVETGPRLAGLQFRFVRKFKDAVVPRLPAVLSGGIRDLSARYRVFRHRRALGDAFQGSRAVTEGQLSEYAADLRRFLSIARENDIRVLLLAPAIRMDEGTSLDFSANWPFIHPDWLVDAKSRFLEATLPIAASAQVPLLDLDEVVAENKESLMPDAFHFSDAGAEMVAEAVADRVGDRWGWFQESPTP